MDVAVKLKMQQLQLWQILQLQLHLQQTLFVQADKLI
jgi:hypothetical protein